MLGRVMLLGVLALAACSSDDEGGVAGAGGVAAQDASSDSARPIDAAPDVLPEADAETPPCPEDMVLVDAFCVDRFEAPNQAGALPLVMYTFDEADAWCAFRQKRLCWDDEWTRSCAGLAETQYPYGDTHQPGTCNDDEVWKLYDQSKLNGWPITVGKPEVASLAELLAAARAVSPVAKVSADHVEDLYQAEPAGQNAGCVGPDGVLDTQGNVEEWTRRRDGGDGPEFEGNLKGRYWAEARTCQGGVKSHGDGFRFYEIGFRCCRDASGP
jgi:formylglycine-generating enzyme required for sulfatase activity